MHTEFQKKAHLRECGFEYVRSTTHGEIWSDGISRIHFSRSTKHAHEFLRDVEKAVNRRQQQQNQVVTKLDLSHVKVVASPNQSPVASNKRSLVMPMPQTSSTSAEAEVPAPVIDKRGIKFSPEDRQLLCLRVEELLNEGKGVAEITAVLNSEGARSPTGDPLARHWVERVVRLRRKAAAALFEPATPEPEARVVEPAAPIIKEEPQVEVELAASTEEPVSASATATQSTTNARIPSFAEAILTEPTLNPEQRLRMLRCYADLVPLSPMMTAILTEPMTTAQAFKMLEAYLGL